MLESRVQSAGGIVRSESALDRAAIIARGIVFRNEVSRWRNSVEAVDTAMREVHRLFDEFKRHADEIAARIPQIRMRYNASGKKSCDVSIRGIGFSVRWYSSYGDSLDSSGLIFETWEHGRFMNESVVLQTKTGSYEHGLDLDATRITGWRKSNDDRFLTTTQLAESWVKQLIDIAHKNSKSVKPTE